MALGLGNLARAYGEVSLGMFSTDYTATVTTASSAAAGYSSNDRLLVIGNGTTHTTRHDAMTVYKNGTTKFAADNITFSPSQLFNSSGAPTELRFAESTTNGVNYVGFKSSSSVGTDVMWTLPATDGANGDQLTTDGSGVLSWAAASDRNKKENFHEVDSESVLRKYALFNLTTWNYIGEGEKGIRHYGPMAQDFFAAFGNDGVGVVGNDTTIRNIDMQGVNFTAIQALEKRTHDLQEVIDMQKKEIAQLKSQHDSNLASLQTMLKVQEEMLQSMKEENALMKKAMIEIMESVKESNTVRNIKQ